MLEDFTSLWITEWGYPLCRQFRASATAMATLNLTFQGIIDFSLWPVSGFMFQLQVHWSPFLKKHNNNHRKSPFNLSSKLPLDKKSYTKIRWLSSMHTPSRCVMCLCFNEDTISTSKEKSFQASLYCFRTFTATSLSLWRDPLYTLLHPPSPIKFPVGNVELAWIKLCQRNKRLYQ